MVSICEDLSTCLPFCATLCLTSQSFLLGKLLAFLLIEVYASEVT